MSRKKMKREHQTSIRLDDDLLEWVMTIKELLRLGSVNEAVRVTFEKAYPDIEEIVGKLQKKKEELRNQIDEDETDAQ